MERIIVVRKHLASILNVIAPLAPWAGTLPAMPWVLRWVSVRARAVNECLHPDGTDGVEEVPRANARRPAGFRHAPAEAASATPVAVIPAMVHVG